MKERRLSTPLVLASASAMLAIGLVIYAGLVDQSEAEPEPEGPADLHVDDSTPEAAAQSFLDAWRRRRWPEATELSVGQARAQVLQKQASDEALEHDERIIAERMWDALARAPLTLALEEVEMHGNERYTLQGVAEYDFVRTPYRRRVAFDVEGSESGYRVSEMRLGEVLSELPSIFGGDDAP